MVDISKFNMDDVVIEAFTDPTPVGKAVTELEAKGYMLAAVRYTVGKLLFNGRLVYVGEGILQASPGIQRKDES